jgi:WD40 repeat protein
MLGNFGEVLVMDWGIALSTSAYLHHDMITQSNSMGGTPAYMAPEMATGPLTLIGPRSDVYLLGAVLFEILTGLTPHTGHDVLSCLRAAAQNEIQYCEQEGELLDIAYKAMATDLNDRYEDVHTFQDAIRMYQSHSESILLAARADEDLQRARETKDYQDFSRALFAYQEAVALWPDHTRAAHGIEDVQLAYATTALAKGDFDLGLSLLDESRPSHRPLRQKLLAAQVERDLRQTRLRSLRRTAVALGVSTMLVLIVGLVVTFGLYRVAKHQTAEAKTQQDEAVRQQKKAEREEKEATRQQLIAEKQTKLAKEEKERADDRAKVAREQEQRAERASYVAKIGLAAAQVQENAFLEARRVVKGVAEAASVTTTGARHWEWGRLKFLSERATQSVNADSRIEQIAWTPDGQWLLVGTADEKVRIWNAETKEFQAESLPLDGSARALAVAPRDGFVATASDDSGTIKIWQLGSERLQGGTVPKEPARTLVGHEGAVVSLRFSKDGQFLLSTSTDSTARLWDMKSGEQRERFGGHLGTIWDAAISDDNQSIFTAGDDGYVGIWNRKSTSDKRTGRFAGHSGPVYAIAVTQRKSDSSPLIISGGNDRFVLAWDPTQVNDFDYEELEKRMGELELEKRTRSNSDSSSQSTITIFAGHTSEIRTLDVSPDGETVVSGGHDNTVRVWKLQSEEPQPPAHRVLRGHGGWVRGVAHRPGESLFLVSGGYDQFLQFWDVDTYFESLVLSGHEDALLALEYSVDGSRIITAGRDGKAKIWNAETGQEVRTLREGHEFLTTSAAFFPSDAQRMVTSAGDGSTIIWRLDTGGELHRLPDTGQNSVVAVSAKGNWVATGSRGNEVQVWAAGNLTGSDDPSSAIQPIRLQGHKQPVTVAAFHPRENDGETLLYTGDDSGAGILWRFDSATNRWQTPGLSLNDPSGRPITAARFLPDGSRVVTASATGAIRHWRVSDGKEIVSDRLQVPGDIRCFDVSPDGKLAAAAYAVRDRQGPDEEASVIWHLQSWDLEGPTQLQLLTWNASQSISSIAFAPVGEELILATDDTKNAVWKWNVREPNGRQPYWTRQQLRPPVWLALPVPGQAQLLTLAGTSIRIWDNERGRRVRSFGPHNAITSVDFSHDGKRAVAGSTDGTVKVWDVERGRVIVKLPPAHIVESRAGAIHVAQYGPVLEDGFADGPAEDILLTAGADGVARLWKLSQERFEQIHEMQGPGGSPILAAAFSPDARWIVTGSADGRTCVWDSQTGDKVHEMGENERHRLAVNHVAFSADGLQLLTGGDDNTAILWETVNWQRKKVLEGHTAAVTSVAFSPDRRRILTASRDGAGKLWETDTFSEVFTVKGHAAEINVATFSPNGRQVATAGGDGRAIVWLADEIHPSLSLRSDDLAFPSTQKSPLAIDEEAEFLDPFVRGYGQSRLSVRVERESKTPVEELSEVSLDSDEPQSPIDPDREELQLITETQPEKQYQFTMEGDKLFMSQPRRGDTQPLHVASVQFITPTELEFEIHEPADRFAIEVLIRSLGYFAEWNQDDPVDDSVGNDSSLSESTSDVPSSEESFPAQVTDDRTPTERKIHLEIIFTDGSPELSVERIVRFETISQ